MQNAQREQPNQKNKLLNQEIEQSKPLKNVQRERFCEILAQNYAPRAAAPGAAAPAPGEHE